MTVSNTVPIPEPEREPRPWLDTTPWDGPSLDDVQASYEQDRRDYFARRHDEFVVDETVIAPPVVHYNPATAGYRHTPCGEPLDELPVSQAEANPARVTCRPCAATLVDGQLAEPEPDDDLQDCARCGDLVTTVSSRGWCDGCEGEATTPAEPAFPELQPPIGPVEPPAEHCTVGLEVLTPELRAVANKAIAAEYRKHDRKPELLPPESRAAVVVRAGGQLESVTDVETDVPQRNGAEALAWLLGQAQGRAWSLDAELLMPTMDVIGALSGNPWAAFTAPVESRWGLVKRGWYVLVDIDGEPGTDWALVDDRVECRDPVCLVRGESPSWACAVATLQDRCVQHLDAFASIGVRIPAGEL